MAETTNPPVKSPAETSRAEATRGASFTPRVDIFETDKELTLYAELPGVRPEDVDLRYENGELLLHGRVKPRPGQRNLLLHEFDEGDFYRVFAIHESIDAGRIEAECKNGVLIVHLPKVEAVRPRQINVHGS